MNKLAHILDLAIKKQEAPDLQNKYFELNGKKYERYIDNLTWQEFVENMRVNYPSAYRAFSSGQGDELGIHKKDCPPKMACYGSSSRMLFSLCKDIKDFCFEYKLPTTVGGIAHLDGYLKEGLTAIYIEAKCHEPYNKNLYNIDIKYEDLYQYLTRHMTDFACEIETKNKDEMHVKFFANNKQLEQFDIKQMICHLLAIATKNLTSSAIEKTKFIYLLFNPKLVEIDRDYVTEIISKYEKEVDECNNIPFKNLYKAILTYLSEYKQIGNATPNFIADLTNNFSFSLHDQTTLLNEFKNA